MKWMDLKPPEKQKIVKVCRNIDDPSSRCRSGAHFRCLYRSDKGAHWHCLLEQGRTVWGYFCQTRAHNLRQCLSDKGAQFEHLSVIQGRTVWILICQTRAHSLKPSGKGAQYDCFIPHWKRAPRILALLQLFLKVLYCVNLKIWM